MKIKKQYEMKDPVWIHLGNGKLTKGTVIDIFDLAHAGYDKDMEFYIVEIPTEIEALLEVRTWETMSQDAKGPIGCYRTIKEHSFSTQRYLGKVGIELPKVQINEETILSDDIDPLDPTPEEVNAAIERAENAKKMMYQVQTPADKPKRYFKKKTTKTARKV